ncbi:uncharacterized protein N7459_009867 [Penicillium hispanicum]|uniref:uncharacterized protein n=1 Tax=Penicillium hispanicum TaxID=1080232 RepID=UPI0025425D57|nr:uncharacterized protein N7459_009867 [Penicillium hispanicum]KAJ5570437.1 hypothetical protein N7459_009867 [Penicillium hispanicum]
MTRSQGIVMIENGSDNSTPEAATLQKQLCAAQDLDSVRSVVIRELLSQPTPTRIGVRLALMVALRVTELVCQSVDRLLERPASGTRGAFHDSGMYRPCRRGNGDHRVPVDNEQGLRELFSMIDIATNYLQKLGAFDDYASVITRLVQVSSFHHDSDDLIVHRCLLASHALAEGYVGAKQSELSAADYPHGAQPVRYPKDDVKQAVLRTVSGPILGHHQILTCNSAMCFDSGMNPKLAFVSYKENLCWLVDWALAHREDGDILATLTTIVGSNSAIPSTANAGRLSHESLPTQGKDLSWRVRNEVGSEFTQWLANMDQVVKESTNPSLIHTGVLCTVGDLVRKVLVASVAYGSWQFWPTPRPLTFHDYTELVCAFIGAMVRGWAIDHDTEASIREHNSLNWVCKDCSTALTSEVLGPANARATRDDSIMRLAWGPQTYFFVGLRHHGFARRVDNLREKNTDLVYHKLVRRITPYCSPIVAGDNVPIIVTKLLALCGIQLVDFHDDLGEKEWDCQPRMCSKCQFDGYRAQLFMVSVGVARLAAMVLDHDQSQPLVRLMDNYGYRLFPAVQTRLLVLCPCIPRWTSDVMSQAYADAGTSCGQSDCSLPASQCHNNGLSMADGYNDNPLTEALLCQAFTEAESYANKTGQHEWLDTVSKPLRI